MQDSRHALPYVKMDVLIGFLKSKHVNSISFRGNSMVKPSFPRNKE